MNTTIMHLSKLFRKYMAWDSFPFRKSPVIHLGRWSVDHGNKTIKNRVDLANEDHCGPCGQYRLTKTDSLYKEKSR